MALLEWPRCGSNCKGRAPVVVVVVGRFGGLGSGVNMCTAGGQMLPQTRASDHVSGSFLSPDVRRIPGTEKTKSGHERKGALCTDIPKVHKRDKNEKNGTQKPLWSGLKWSSSVGSSQLCGRRKRKRNFPCSPLHCRGLGEASDTP